MWSNLAAMTKFRDPALCMGVRGPFGLFPVQIALAQLRTHLHIVGSSGQGKSKLLQHLLYQLITAGWGCGLVDPHSDLAGDLLAQLASYPRRRPWLADRAQRRRLIYLDPARSDYVVPANLLRNAAATPYEIAENIVEGFRRVWPQTLAEAPRFAQILRNAVLVLEEGRIAAAGAHDDLVMDSPLYNEIVHSQLRADKQPALLTAH